MSIDKKYSLWFLIKSDIDYWGGISEVLFRLGFYATLSYRVAYFLSNHKLTIISKILQFLSQIVTGSEISHRAQIGPSFRLLHPSGVHIGPGVIIGEKGTLCECSSIVYTDQKIPPIVGDKLWLGPGARIMGNVELGDEVWVGPNSVVLKNIPSQHTAFGIPARPLPKEMSSRLK